MNFVRAFSLILSIACKDVYAAAAGSTVRGLQYGQDCTPSDSMDTKYLEKVAESEVYKKQFGAEVPIITLSAEEWTPDMEDVYVNGFFDDPKRCSIIENLECQLKQNENTEEVNFHHHHDQRQGNEIPNSTQKLDFVVEPRRADIVGRESILEFDVIPELIPEWRCVCNPSVSVHRGVHVKDKSFPHPYFNDTCLVKVGLPCKFKAPSLATSKHFKAEYSCVAAAECVTVPETKGLDAANGSSLNELLQLQIESMVGYRLVFGGVRPAFQNYLLRHLTHVCACAPAFVPNGNGLCVNSRSALQGKGIDTNSSPSTKRLFYLNRSFLHITFLYTFGV